MAYNSAGTYTSVSGAETAVAGNIVQSAVWDAIHSDIRVALTQTGQSSMGSGAYNNLVFANGGFEVWQRGAGDSAVISVAQNTIAYTADRWYISTGATQAHTISAVAGLTSGSRHACAIQRTAAQNGVAAMTFGYPLDTDEVIRMRGHKASLNFWASTGANWSPANGTFTATLYVGTGGVAKRGAGFAGETTVLQVSTNLAAGSAATNITGISAAAVPTNATQGELQFAWTPVGAAGGADTLTLDDVQLEASVYSDNGFIVPYRRLPFRTMLRECKTHYRKTFVYGTAPAQGAGTPGALTAVTQAAAFFGIYWQFEPIALRTTATYTTYNPSGATANWQDVTAAASLAVGIDNANSSSPSGVLLYGATAAAAGDFALIHAAADASI